MDPIYAVITGDITDSRKREVSEWLPLLKEALNRFGTTPREWEIFRGDSFQLVLPAEKAFEAAVYIKACIKVLKELDVRIGIGIGSQDYRAKRVSESNGSAFVFSGEAFERLEKEQLSIQTSSSDFDETLNLMFSLALLSMDNWSPIVAFTVKTALEHPGKNQKELASILGKSQSNLSATLSRATYDEVMRVNEYYKKQVQHL